MTITLVFGVAAATMARAHTDAPLKFNCVVIDARISADRTHVRCANKGMNGLSEFAAETSQPYANRVADAIVQALRNGSPLTLTYAPAPELNPDGCPMRTCRKIIDVGGTGRIAPHVPPALLPSLMDAPTPQVQPADFDPVDASIDEPAIEGTPVAPPPAPVHRPMQPVVN